MAFASEQSGFQRHITRRYLLGRTGLGVGAAALGSLLGRDANAASRNPLAPKTPPHTARAKSVIYIHLTGGPSQLDMFDYKPLLQKHDGQPCPKELLEGKQFAFIRGVPRMLGSPFRFSRHGEAGLELSELLPHLGTVADEICMIKSVCTDQFNHAPAQMFAHTGEARLGSPSIGAWVTYGLGSENENLPGFVVLLSGGTSPDAGKSLWGCGFLPSVYQGVQCRNTGDPILYLSNPPGVTREARRDMLDVLESLNRRGAEHFLDDEINTRVSQYELAFRMQAAVPDVMDISREPGHVLDMYGAAPGGKRADGIKGADPVFANNCLLARRLVESGVRFVQLFDRPWDHHGVADDQDLTVHLPQKCRDVDRPIAALIRDLKQRGLLEQTLVIFGGEFGRTPMKQNTLARFVGRDHHVETFCIGMAGGGVRPGTYGATDDIGYYPTENKTTVHDLHATILHQLGFDPYRFSYPYQGLDHRLIGPDDRPEIIGDILS